MNFEPNPTPKTPPPSQVQASHGRRWDIPKRVLDIGLASIGIVLSSPLWILAAVAVKLEDGGPVFYPQRRYGRGGQIFRLLKFRTMRPGSDEAGIVSATEKDDLVTRVGHLLRATGLDELPQLWSILIGNMSLVGPRALAVGEAIRMPDGHLATFDEIPGFLDRLAVKPGLTGMATIYLPKDVDPIKKLEYDLAYIDNQSFWLDVRLIALSLWISVRGKWETRTDKL